MYLNSKLRRVKALAFSNHFNLFLSVSVDKKHTAFEPFGVVFDRSVDQSLCVCKISRVLVLGVTASLIVLRQRESPRTNYAASRLAAGGWEGVKVTGTFKNNPKWSKNHVLWPTETLKNNPKWSKSRVLWPPFWHPSFWHPPFWHPILAPPFRNPHFGTPFRHPPFWHPHFGTPPFRHPPFRHPHFGTPISAPHFGTPHFGTPFRNPILAPPMRWRKWYLDFGTPPPDEIQLSVIACIIAQGWDFRNLVDIGISKPNVSEPVLEN